MKQLFKLFSVALMVAAVSVAGCGDKKKEGTKGKDGATEEKKDDAASTSPATGEMVATKVSLPGMDTHWT